jgi:RimJ/RimL family protein N-acetyltransferase
MNFMVREMIRSDLDILFKYMNSREIAYLTDHRITSYEEFYNHYSLYLEGKAIDLKIMVIVLDGVVVGKMELGYDLEHKTGVFEIVIGNKQFWGKGIAKRALHVLFSLGFNNLGLNKLSCEVFGYNTRSLQFMQKQGMHLDGILRQERVIDQHYVDIYLYSKLRNEFEGGYLDD